jgi:maltooligosyltrehalose trehalohydrolase
VTTQSARPSEDGVAYRVWAPRHAAGEVVILNDAEEPIRSVELVRDDDGVFIGSDPEGWPGDLYKLRFDDGQLLPDMASHFQPFGVHGPSQVIDHSHFVWPDESWARPSLAELVIYEVHVGTFTREGTYRAAEAKVAHVKDLGATAIQLMPLGDFAGERNWGYDGVSIYAPARCYGTTDDLKHFIAAVHKLGLAVILDVVYNHFGPDGNYLECFSEDYFSSRRSIWGKNLNFDGRNSKFVREHFIGNVIHWMEHYHIDGFRLDATHAIIDETRPHVLSEIACEVEQRDGFTIAEDERNWAGLITARDDGIGIDAAWADDFHHVVKVALTGERFAHFRSYRGSSEELLDVVQNGWLFRGQIYPQWKRPRGTECGHLPTEKFVYCISNHDQAGNRPLGERLNHLVSVEAYRAASALLCVLPYTPMLFMGQEWAASTAFCFFTDHTGELGKNVSTGRLKEFDHYGADFGAETLARMPDPQEEATFINSKLDWNDLEKDEHQKVLGIYRQFLGARHDFLTPETRARGNWTVELIGGAILALRYSAAAGAVLVLCDLKGGHTARLNGAWRKKLSSLDSFGGGAVIENCSMQFARPETVWLEEME